MRRRDDRLIIRLRRLKWKEDARSIVVLVVGALVVLLISALATVLYAVIFLRPLSCSWDDTLRRINGDRFADALLAGMLTAGATLILGFIAWKQLKGISDTASADFLLKLERDFFTEDARVLTQSLENHWLKYVPAPNAGESHFVVDEQKIDGSPLHRSLKARLMARPAFSTYDLDDLFLGHLEDVGTLLRDKILVVEMVYEEFHPYIKIACSNPDVQHYFRELRKRPGAADVYDQLGYANEECRRYARIKGYKY